MNPRVSRSSALASKATGFPIAKIAAKLAVGYTLDELDNDITKVTPASFEPTIDYVVTKIPRFAFEKFPGSKPELTTAMKSVGEAMAIGRTFHEALQKALCSMETGLTGFDEIEIEGVSRTTRLPKNASLAVRRRAQRARRRTGCASSPRPCAKGLPLDEIQAATAFDMLVPRAHRRDRLGRGSAWIAGDGLPEDRGDGLRRLKMMGFTDARLARLTNLTEGRGAPRPPGALGVTAVFKRIDTCAAEFEAQTPYMYSTYEALRDGRGGMRGAARRTARRS